uniref:Uncharacterized protein n=1 Tax=Arundo donax TaxID=35708 RepID=A0A0A9G150_ARUDO
MLTKEGDFNNNIKSFSLLSLLLMDSSRFSLM